MKKDNSPSPPNSQWQEAKEKNKAINHSYLDHFQYRHDNPYHKELSLFNDFVLRDDEAEKYPNQWNKKIFTKENPLHVEIGTGFGHFMLDFCQKNPHVNFVGLDYRFKRSFALAKKLAKVTHRNFKYLRAKGERLSFLFGKEEIDTLYYFFPDPWPKKRQHKKRLFQPPFLKAVEKCLAPDGYFYIKTDHDDYFQWMLDVLKEQEVFQVIMKTHDLHKEAPDHFLAKHITKFEKIFLAKKIPIKALVLRKKEQVK